MKIKKKKTIKNKTKKKIPQKLTHKTMQKVKEREIVRKIVFQIFQMILFTCSLSVFSPRFLEHNLFKSLKLCYLFDAIFSKRNFFVLFKAILIFFLSFYLVRFQL